MNYPKLLNQCWQKHLDNDKKGPTVISTFAGCGGSSLGYSMAGFHELLAVEWDDKAVETLRLNFPNVKVFHNDIANLSIDECLALAGIKVGELDVLDGSPPCQGFSTAGKRNYGDDRNSLYREYLRLLIGLKPKVFVMENVSGLIKGIMKNRFLEIMADFKNAGYRVKCKLMNAANYHVPQSRSRIIFLGIRNDLKEKITFPIKVKPIYTVKEAWKELPEDNEFHTSPLIITYWKKTKPGKSCGKFHARKKLDFNKPSPCFTHRPHYHPFKAREITLIEDKRLASFPDQFTFIDNRLNAMTQIANSVLPLMMMAIAEHIRKHLLPKGE